MGGRGLAWGTTTGRASYLTEPCRAWGGCASPKIHPNRERVFLKPWPNQGLHVAAEKASI